MTDKTNWLDEVKLDADYNYRKRLREQEADRAFEAAKANGSVSPVEALEVLDVPELKKGK